MHEKHTAILTCSPDTMTPNSWLAFRRPAATSAANVGSSDGVTHSCGKSSKISLADEGADHKHTIRGAGIFKYTYLRRKHFQFQKKRIQEEIFLSCDY